MASKIILHLNQIFRRVESILPSFFRNGFPPEPMYAMACPNYALESHEYESNKPFSVKDLIGDGIFWAVPKSRRSLEKRQKRKFGWPGKHVKLMLPKTHLRICIQCGHDHEIGVLCPNCYKRVMDETNEMKEKIVEKLGLQPVDKEVVVLYENDKPAEFWEGKRVIELEKQRPYWFTKNLLQKTTQPKAMTKEVKPSDLG